MFEPSRLPNGSYEQIDAFTHPKTGRSSKCFRVNYRSMDRNITNEEANVVNDQIIKKLKETFGVEIR
jgi:phenylalanyl-tRNA synthetase alpha chain